MSVDERLQAIEENVEKLTEPEHQCIFCIDRNKHNFWHFTEVTDPLIKEYFAKKGLTECNHDEMDEPSIWFADFVACSLLGYVFDNYLERQTDVPFLDECLHKKEIMIPAMRKKIEKELQEFPLEHFDEHTAKIIQAKRDLQPQFIDMFESII